MNTVSEPILSIEIWGLRILEPITSLTDVITGLVSIVCFFLLQHHSGRNSIIKNYFFFVGLATLSAGILGHALLWAVGAEWKILGWILSALGMFFLESGMIRTIRFDSPHPWHRLLKLVPVVKIGIFGILTILPQTRSFEVVQINSAAGLVLFVFPLALWQWIKYRDEGSKWTFLAVVFGFLPGMVYNFELAVNIWLDHHGISHILMTFFTLILYKGIRLKLDSPLI